MSGPGRRDGPPFWLARRRGRYDVSATVAGMAGTAVGRNMAGPRQPVDPRDTAMLHRAGDIALAVMATRFELDIVKPDTKGVRAGLTDPAVIVEIHVPEADAPGCTADRGPTGLHRVAAQLARLDGRLAPCIDVMACTSGHRRPVTDPDGQARGRGKPGIKPGNGPADGIGHGRRGNEGGRGKGNGRHSECHDLLHHDASKPCPGRTLAERRVHVRFHHGSFSFSGRCSQQAAQPMPTSQVSSALASMRRSAVAAFASSSSPHCCACQASSMRATSKASVAVSSPSTTAMASTADP